MLINIANTPKYKFIEEETIRISKELGFKQEKTIELTLSSVMGAGYKYEPIFVFKKWEYYQRTLYLYVVIIYKSRTFHEEKIYIVR